MWRDPATPSGNARGEAATSVAVTLPGALLPPEIARAAETAGVEKTHKDALTLFGLAVLGGAFVALGGLFATVVSAGADGHLAYGVTRLLAGLVFSLGLVLVVVAGAQLFTSDCLMVMAWASGRLRLPAMLRVWTIVWVGNFVGALGTAGLVFLSGQYKFGHGKVGEAALYVAAAKSTLPIDEAFFLGILCNVLVCLAAWLALSARSVSDKILAVMLPVSAFVAAGFEHCVADMYFMPLGLMILNGAPASFWADIGHAASASAPIPLFGFLTNLVAVTFGNWVGGALFVGGTYWILYRRKEATGH